MDEDVGRAWELVVDDVVHGGNVKSSGGDVGREEDAVRGGLEAEEVKGREANSGMLIEPATEERPDSPVEVLQTLFLLKL